ncbi:MAG: LysR family transcriptional regulator [Pseudomonadota bacterium]
MRIRSLKTIIALGENNGDFSIYKILGIPRSSMWAHIDEIERDTGLTLVNRKKQNTTLTDDGWDFIPYAKKICRVLDEGVHTIKGPEQTIGLGEVFISTTEAVCASWLMPSIKAFHAQHPRLKVHIIANNEFNKETAKIVDILLRPVGDLEKFDKKWFISYHHALFASKKYLNKAGTPETPEDLIRHSIIGYGEHKFSYFDEVNWHLKGNKYGLPKLTPTLTVNSTKSIFLAAQEGIGICSAPIESNTFYKSKLQRVLPQIEGPRVDTYFCMRRNASEAKRRNMDIFNKFFKNYMNKIKVVIHENKLMTNAA